MKKELGCHNQPNFPDQPLFILPTRAQQVKDLLRALVLLSIFSALYYQVAMLAIETYLDY